MIVFPAMDLREGRVVRLAQGDYARETRYEVDPLALAERYAAAGARWLHVVDLDAAREGAGRERRLIGAIARSSGLKLQVGGGVRERADVEALFRAGAERVVVGSVAARDPDKFLGWLEAFGAERLVLALDVRRGEDRVEVLAAGWTEGSGRSLGEVLAGYGARARHVLCTDVARDGLLGGVDAEFYAGCVRRWPAIAWQASGGVASEADLDALRPTGVSGVVVGRALLEGRVSERVLGAEVAPC